MNETGRHWLTAHGACEEAVEWAAPYETLAAAWTHCQRPDWMLWALHELGLTAGEENESKLRLFACWCVRQVWHLLDDERSRHAVEVAERYTRGQATDEELAATRDAAWDAAWDAAGVAAWAAAGDAARVAAWVAAGDAAGVAAWGAAGDAAGDAQANKLREYFPQPFT